MSDIKHKMQQLNEIAIELKQELYGIDNIIDRVIKSTMTNLYWENIFFLW